MLRLYSIIVAGALVAALVSPSLAQDTAQATPDTSEVVKATPTETKTEKPKDSFSQ